MEVTFNVWITNYGHPERTFFSKIRNFWTWADKLGWIFMRHLGYFWPNYQHYFGTVSLFLMGQCSWFSFLQKGLKHITSLCSQNKILAGKNLGNSVHTSIFCGLNQRLIGYRLQTFPWLDVQTETQILSWLYTVLSMAYRIYRQCFFSTCIWIWKKAFAYRGTIGDYNY